MSMTLKTKSYICALLIILVLATCVILSHKYQATSNKLMNFIMTLDEIMQLSHEIEIATLIGNLDPDVLVENAKEIPVLFQQLQDDSQSADAAVIMTDLGISIIRFARAANLSLPGNTLQQPLLEL